MLGCLLLVDFALPVKQNRIRTVDDNAAAGALISSGMGKEAPMETEVDAHTKHLHAP